MASTPSPSDSMRVLLSTGSVLIGMRIRSRTGSPPLVRFGTGQIDVRPVRNGGSVSAGGDLPQQVQDPLAKQRQREILGPPAAPRPSRAGSPPLPTPRSPLRES